MRKLLAVTLLFALLLTGCAKKDPDNGPDNEPGSAVPLSAGETDPYETAITPAPAQLEDGTVYDVGNRLRVVSYNIRCANDKDGNSIAERAPRLQQVLTESDPDLIGFQEVTPTWMEYLTEDFGEKYDYVLKYRAATSLEGTPIFYKKEKFKLLDTGCFWFSETPEQTSKGWGADFYRICSWVKLEVRATGAVFYYYNTHWDFTEEPQLGSAALLIDRVKEGNLPAVCTADFNMNQDSKGYTAMTDYFTDVNMATAREVTGTYQNYGKVSNLIDYCFVTETIRPLSYRVMTEQVDGAFVSDHYGICSDLIILQEETAT